MKTKTTHLRTKRQKCMALLLLPFVCAAVLWLAVTAYVAWVMPHMPPCILRTLTGWRCPSCGMTHSVMALCRLDLVGAAKENLMIPLAAVAGLIYYAEGWLRVCSPEKRLLPRKGLFWLGMLVFWLCYTVLRNLI